jgi:YihY family inner membrane protein
MQLISARTLHVLRNPVGFALQVLKAFRANQGMLLAGAVAYYALLSILPLLILMVIALSQIIDEEVLLETLRRALEYLVPGEGMAVVTELQAFLDHRAAIGWVLLVTILFFSSLCFSALENAITVIFRHRVKKLSRHFLVSFVLPFGYIIFISTVLFVGAVVIADLMVMSAENYVLLGYSWSLSGFSQLLMYVVGFVGEILLISAIYYFMPVGRLSVHHALIGGVTAASLWEVVRFALRWYFDSLSQVNVVYGSLTTSIVVLISLDVAAALLLLGAQVIAEYERIEVGAATRMHMRMRAKAK